MTEFILRNRTDLAIPHPRTAIAPQAAFGISAAALGYALQLNFGQYDPTALACLAVSIIAAVIGLSSISRATTSSRGAMPVLIIGLILQFLILLTANPMATLRFHSSFDLLPFRLGILAASALMIPALRGGHSTRLSWTLVLATHFLLGLWVLHAMPQPQVDVCLFQRDAAQALLTGHNPYTLSFPNLYPDAARVYGAGTFAGNRLLFGYPYPPLSLFFILPAHLLGDFRLSHLLATTLAGALIAAARPDRIATAAAALFLFTPRMFFVLEAGWTEPLAVLLLATVVFIACRIDWSVDRFSRPIPKWSLPVAVGLFLVVKQYLILVAPLGVLLLLRPSQNRPRTRLILAAATAALITLPLALWNLRPFLWSVALLQFHQPMREDALSFLPLLVNTTHLPGAGLLPFAAALAVIIWAVVKCPRTPGAFAAATALAFLLFFALNKQAFCNYYFFVIGGLCCAVATASNTFDVRPRIEVTV